MIDIKVLLGDIAILSKAIEEIGASLEGVSTLSQSAEAEIVLRESIVVLDKCIPKRRDRID